MKGVAFKTPHYNAFAFTCYRFRGVVALKCDRIILNSFLGQTWLVHIL